MDAFIEERLLPAETREPPHPCPRCGSGSIMPVYSMSCAALQFARTLFFGDFSEGSAMSVEIGLNLEYIRCEDKPFEEAVSRASAIGYRYVEPMVHNGREL